MSKERIQIPRIRFSEYFNVWKICKLKEISERITKKNSELESSLPLTISAQYGLVDQITYFNKRIASKNITNYYLLEKGDFAYNKSYSKDYPWGVVKRLDGYDKGVLSTLYIVFKPTRVNSNFLLTYYDTNNWHKEVSMRAAEGARNHGLLNITALDFFDTDLFIPVEKEEQKKIGEFFKRLEETIILHQQLLNDHKQLKKAMLQKMFPQKGDTVPKLRFAGYTDDWEEKKLDKLVTIKTGKLDANAMNPNGTYPFFTCARETYKTSTYSFDGENLLIAGNGDIGFIKYYKGKFDAYQRTYILGNIKVDAKFLQYILTKTLPERIYSLTYGSTMPYITISVLADMLLMIPDMAEQTKIGNFFKQLDETIVLHEKKLETYQELKKAMLQKMFV